MFKKIFIMAATVIFLLTGCNSDSSSSDKQTSNNELPELDRTDTLEGIDKNQNGIRDDIENYIVKNYSDEGQRKALFQYAKVLQEDLLVDVSDAIAVKKVGTKGSRAIHCVFLQFKNRDVSDQNPDIASGKIFSMTTNTKARLKAYLKFNKAMDGTAWALPKGDTCE
jgi:uncharacterized lipoprotein NlpE involved in copper resistance